MNCSAADKPGMPRAALWFFMLVLAVPPCTAGSGPAHYFDVVARGLEFDAPAATRPGWNTVRFRNEAGMVHFALIERLPDGIGLRQQQDEVAPVFQQGMDLLAAGDADAAQAAFGGLPAWFSEVIFLGGPGLTGPGGFAAVTMYLQPGNYLLECYVKTAGVFHSYNPDPGGDGMVRAFTVAGDEVSAPEPSPNLTISISGDRGFEISGDAVTGDNTIRISFDDQQLYGNFVGHDLHLVRLEADTELPQLERWMDWTRVDGLQTPAPARFIGGVNEMPAGSVAYLHVSLDPGRYAWIAEVPDPAGKGMMRVFDVR